MNASAFFQPRTGLALLVSFACIALAGCGQTRPDTTAPEALSQALTETRLDERALETCRASGTTPVAALDSNPSAAMEIQGTARSFEEYDYSLPDPSLSYVAICIYDASEIDGLAPDMKYMTMWETEWDGSGILVAW